jgi:hypothetical protein
MVQQEITVQDGQSAILEAGNFTNDVAICQVEMACFFSGRKVFQRIIRLNSIYLARSWQRGLPGSAT